MARALVFAAAVAFLAQSAAADCGAYSTCAACTDDLECVQCAGVCMKWNTKVAGECPSNSKVSG